MGNLLEVFLGQLALHWSSSRLAGIVVWLPCLQLGTIRRISSPELNMHLTLSQYRGGHTSRNSSESNVLIVATKVLDVL